MGETIDELDDPDAGRPERSEETTTAQPDTSGFDSMFPEDDLASIFDPDSSDDKPANEFDVEPDEPVPPRRPRPTPIPADRQPQATRTDRRPPRSMSTAASQPPIGTGRTPNRRRLISMTILRIRRTTGLEDANDGTEAATGEPAAIDDATDTGADADTDSDGTVATDADDGTDAESDTPSDTDTDAAIGGDEGDSIFGGGSDSIFGDDEDGPTMTTGRCSTGARRMTTGRSSETTIRIPVTNRRTAIPGFSTAKPTRTALKRTTHESAN